MSASPWSPHVWISEKAQADSMECDDWYRLRDDRTGRIAGALPFDTFHPLVLLPSEADESVALANRVLLDVLARFCRNVTIAPAQFHPPRDWRRTSSALIARMQSADPCGRFRVLDAPQPPWGAGPIVIVGEEDLPDPPCDVRAMPEGWGCRMIPGDYSRAETTRPANPIGAVLTGCLAAREVFLRLAEPARAPNKAFTFSPLPSEGQTPRWDIDTEIGRCLMVGAGGVGSNVAALLSWAGVRASLTILDFDTVDYTNMNRCLPFNFRDAERGRLKVTVLKDRCANERFAIEPVGTDYEAFVSNHGRGDYDLCFALANERNVLWSIQNNLPPLTWHAAMSPNWGVTVSRHVPMADGCVACMDSFHPSSPPRLVCSEGEIQIGDRAVMGSLPFLGPLTAAVLAARALALAMGAAVEEENVFSLDARSPSLKSYETRLDSTQNCVCRSVDDELYGEFLKGSRYSSLSAT